MRPRPLALIVLSALAAIAECASTHGVAKPTSPPTNTEAAPKVPPSGTVER